MGRIVTMLNPSMKKPSNKGREMFKVYDEKVSKVLAEDITEQEAHIFAQVFTRGSQDRNSSAVWVYDADPQSSVFSEIAVSFYNQGVRYDRVGWPE